MHKFYVAQRSRQWWSEKENATRNMMWLSWFLPCAASPMNDNKLFSYPTAVLRSTGSDWLIIKVIVTAFENQCESYYISLNICGVQVIIYTVNTWKLSQLIILPNETSFTSCDQTGGIATEEDRRRNMLIRISSFKLHSAEVWLYCFDDRRSQLE